MKIAIVSDIHGNYPALQAVLESLKMQRCDILISLGDIAGYYCMINECIDLCRENRVVNILGNHDDYLISGTDCPRSVTASICIEFQRNSISPDNLDWLRASMREYRSRDFWFVHGGWNDTLDEYVGSFDFSEFAGCGVRTFASGHTHVQTIQRNGDLTYFNPGSVGQPRDGDARAAYAVIESDGRVSLHRVRYDIDMIAMAMKANGFDSRVYSGLYSGKRIPKFGTV